MHHLWRLVTQTQIVSQPTHCVSVVLVHLHNANKPQSVPVDSFARAGDAKSALRTMSVVPAISAKKVAVNKLPAPMQSLAPVDRSVRVNAAWIAPKKTTAAQHKFANRADVRRVVNKMTLARPERSARAKGAPRRSVPIPHLVRVVRFVKRVVALPAMTTQPVVTGKFVRAKAA